MVGAGRRTATAYDRFTAYADVPELTANFCPPGFDVETDSVQDCYRYDAHEERDVIAALPEVEAAVSAVVVGALALANVAAAYPAWRAARLHTALALRSE